MLVVSSDYTTYSILFFFFFSSRRRHTRYWRDWSSDVCSSDLCENHGDHMPFGSDFIMPFELAKRVATRYGKKMVIFPPIPYGISSHHKDFFMTISFEPDTMTNVIRDILQSLVNNKIRRILIINGHDGDR